MAPSVLFAWELGRGYGHLLPFVPLARRLRQASLNVVAALREYGAVANPLREQGVSCLAAPCVPEGSATPLNFSDILLNNGFANAADTAVRVGYWRELMQATQASLLVASYAPSALLAARTLGVPAMLFGTPFEVPPAYYPLPAMRYWEDVPAERLARSDEYLRVLINAVLISFGADPLDHIGDLFDVAEQRLIGAPELDHYRVRQDDHFWGVLPSEARGDPAAWPPGREPCIFAYLRWQQPHVGACLEALSRLPVRCVVVCPDLPPDSVLLRQPRVTLHRGAVDITFLLETADLVITQASFGTTCAALLAGRPVLMLPTQLEQYLLARCVVDTLQCGALVRPDEATPDFGTIIGKLLGDGGLCLRASNAATRLKAYGNPFDRMCRRIIELIDD